MALKNQLNAFINELNHLKQLEMRYKEENGEIQRRIDGEGSQNVELTAQIKDLELKIRQKEDQIMFMKRELEAAKYSNAALIETNANL